MARIQELQEQVDKQFTAVIFPGEGLLGYHVYQSDSKKDPGYFLVTVDSIGNPGEKKLLPNWVELLESIPIECSDSDQWEVI